MVLRTFYRTENFIFRRSNSAEEVLSIFTPCHKKRALKKLPTNILSLRKVHKHSKNWILLI